MAESGQSVELDTPSRVADGGRGSFARDIAKLVSGTTAAQIIGILVAPILTRLYAPSDMGVMTLYVSVVTVLAVVINLRYELAIMLPEREEESLNLLAACVAINLSLCTLVALLIWRGGGALATAARAEALAPFLFLVPIGVFITGLYAALTMWNSRSRKFGRLSISRVLQTSVIATVQLGAGFSGVATAGALVAANLAGVVAAMLQLGTRIWSEDVRHLKSAIRWSSMGRLLKRYRKFPLFDTWGAFLNSISWQLPAFMLTFFFSTAVTGYFGLAYRTIGLPMGFIGQAMGQVTFQRAAVARQQGTLAGLVQGVAVRLISFGFFPMALIGVLGHDLFLIVFGAQWSQAGHFAQILSLWAFFWFVASPISNLFAVLEKQQVFLVVNIAIFLSRALSLLIGGLAGSAYLALALYSITGAVVYGVKGVYVIRSSGASMAGVLRSVRPYLGYTLATVAVLSGLHWLGITPVLRIIVGFIAGVGYLFLLAVIEPTVRRQMQRVWPPAQRKHV